MCCQGEGDWGVLGEVGRSCCCFEERVLRCGAMVVWIGIGMPGNADNDIG